VRDLARLPGSPWLRSCAVVGEAISWVTLVVPDSIARGRSATVENPATHSRSGSDSPTRRSEISLNDFRLSIALSRLSKSGSSGSNMRRAERCLAHDGGQLQTVDGAGGNPHAVSIKELFRFLRQKIVYIVRTKWLNTAGSNMRPRTLYQMRIFEYGRAARSGRRYYHSTKSFSSGGKLGKQARAANAAGFTAFLLEPNRSAGIPESLHLKTGS
jgi:hypothetical protein